MHRRAAKFNYTTIKILVNPDSKLEVHQFFPNKRRLFSVQIESTCFHNQLAVLR
uniref:Uncharacterized protein n=1 Tax=Arundo donax TaxID=35708 RepID=A0A0A8ZAW7_ARUDO